MECMLKRLALAASVLAALALPGTAAAGGGDYVFDGGTARERQTVRDALEASSFDWSLVRQRITIHIGPVGVSHAQPGEIWLDSRLLASGRFAWPTVMDEYAHQVDWFVLDAGARSVLQARLGAAAWCYERPGLAHAANGCERFSSMIAWAYWPVKDSAYRPVSARDESASMPPQEFRALLADLVGAPRTLALAGARSRR